MTENQILLALEEKIITESEATTLWIYCSPTYSSRLCHQRGAING